ncbi:MAG: ribonuclease R [Rhodothermia bacterium]|nr:ribonuclease R [Rhodothermia bacterium]
MKQEPHLIRNLILTFLTKNKKQAFRPKELAQSLNIRDNRAFSIFQQELEALVSKGEIQKVSGGKVKFMNQEPHLQVGTLTVHPQGYGFVTILNIVEDIYIPQGLLGYAMDGDTVRISLFAPNRRGNRRQEGRVEEVIERKRTQAVGTLIEDEEDGLRYVRPHDPRLLADVLISPKDPTDAKDGDAVLVSMDRFNVHLGVPEGKILQRIGRADDPAIQVTSLALSRDIRAQFPPNVISAAEAIPLEIPTDEAKRRLDLRGKRVFTIDPYDAKDFDDALHLEQIGEDRYIVGVHIADVSFYVTQNSEIDQEATLRATSVYLVDRVIPMLPEKLSNGVCSLRPNEDKLTFSVMFEVNGLGEVLHYQIVETIIHSQQRLTYEEAQAILEGENDAHPFASDVQMAWKIAKNLRESRFKQGSVRFNRPEVKVKLAEDGTPLEVYAKITKEANWLIEEWMLLANKMVAIHVNQAFKEVPPFVYRTHDIPNAERMMQLAEYLKLFGFEIPHKGGNIQAQDLNRLMEMVHGKPQALLIEDAALRAMAKAKYTVENIGHFGLGFPFYSHFTSPIRRYPDLIAHRLLKKYAQTGFTKPDKDELSATCLHCSTKEKEAEEAERESIRLKQAEYMLQHVGTAYNGVISGVTNFGIYVTITELLVEGMVLLRDLNDDFYDYDEKRYCLIGRKHKKVFQIGNPIRVLVAKADVASRRIDLTLVASATQQKQRPARKR